MNNICNAASSVIGRLKIFEEDRGPRSLRNRNVIEQRRSQLSLPHIEPLTRYVDNLRKKYPVTYFPYFDPADGGINARILFLFEKPGPKTAEPRGSGFISRDNNDFTAESTTNFMNAAGIPRNETITWNVIPGWNSTIDIEASELSGGLIELESLLSLLTKVQVIVLVGRKAQKAKPFVSKRYKVFESFHPSARVKSSRRSNWEQIGNQWKEAYKVLS